MQKNTIKTTEDAQKFLDKMIESKIKDFTFLNEHNFATKYYTRSDKPGVFRKKTWGTGEDDWKTTKNVSAELVFEDKDLINKELETEKKYWTDLGLL